MEQMKKSIEKEWRISLKLSEKDFNRLWNKAGSAGLEPSKLLEFFITDLIHSDKSNGSDERMFAQDWFERSGFKFMLDDQNAFLKYVLDYNCLDDIITRLSILNECSSELWEGESVPEKYTKVYLEITRKEREYQERELESIYFDFLRARGDSVPSEPDQIKAGMRSVISWVRKWNEAREYATEV